MLNIEIDVNCLLFSFLEMGLLLSKMKMYGASNTKFDAFFVINILPADHLVHNKTAPLKLLGIKNGVSHTSKLLILKFHF